MSPSYRTPEQYDRWHVRDCARCGRRAALAANWPDGPICRTCYHKAARTRGCCPGCGASRLLPGRRADQAPICRDCAAITRDFFCDRCGFEGLLLAGRLCERCTLAGKLTTALDDGTGHITTALIPLFDAVTAMAKPQAGLDWLSNNPQVSRLLTGLAGGPIGAALIDLQPPGTQRAPVVTSAFSSLGPALGSLITSALVQYAPAPTRLIWWALLAVFAVSIVTVLAMAEPGSRRPGVLASLRPRVAVPRQAGGTFAGAVPCFVAVWALGGLYLSLGPSLAAAVTASANLLWGGLVIFLLFGTGAAAAFALRSISSRAAMLAGCLFLLAGMAVTLGATATTTSAAFLTGTAVAGVGFGLAYLGAFRMTTALAAPHDRAGLLAAIFIVSYLAFSVPALIADVAITKFGLHRTALVYSASLAALAAAAVGILLFRPGKPSRPALHAVMPPGPCTAPPCPQAMNRADG